MNTSADSQQAFRFGDFELDPRSRELRRRGIRIGLQNQLFELLTLLVKRPGELVTREEIRERLWPGEEFADLNHRLNIAINKIRQALHDSADAPRFVETVPLRGYRFIAPVERVGQSESPKLSRGIFTSVKDLSRKLMRYIRHYNKKPKPIKWTYRDASKRIVPDPV